MSTKQSNEPTTTIGSEVPRARRASARWVLPAIGAALVLARAGTAAALVTAVLPAAMLVAPPPRVDPGFAVGPDIHVFNERQNVILPVAVPVDAQPINPSIQVPVDLNPGVIPAGTCVSSHYVQYQPAALAVADGGASFNQPILGVALLQPSLDATNILGAVGTVYPTAAACGGVPGVDCGLELSPQDGLRIDAFRVRFRLEAEAPGDRLRVITVGDPALCHPWHPGDGDGMPMPD